MVTVMKTEAMRGDWVGQVIDGRFTLLKWLGGSDVNGVFLTQLPGDQPQKAAIRLIPAAAIDADAQLAQWKAAASLSHPHLMRLFYTGSCHVGGDRFFYAVMEYAEEDLSHILPERPLTPAEAREMLDPVLDALSYLHEKGFVHRCLKPSKIMVVNDLVKLSSDSIQVAGKLGKLVPATGVYDAPELATGTISPAADLWSLGVTLVEALTQRPPVWERATQSDPVVPESIPEPFAGIARESLRSDPAHRCTLSDVRTRLNGGGSQQRPAGESGKADSSRFRGPIIAAVLLVVLALIAIFYPRSHEAPPPQTAAEVQSEPATPAPAAETPSEPATPAPAAETPSEPATPAPATPSPAPEIRSSEVAAGKSEVIEQVLPDVLPKAVASIHGKINVKVRVTVDATGAVSSADFDSPGPSKYFAKAALEAAQRWRFKPAQVKGQAVSSVWVLQFQFKQTGTEVTPVKVSP
jgi:TonB family protein